MKTFCIIGLGRFGQTLAKTLIKKGHQVMVLDANPEIINSLSENFTNAVIGDCTSEAVLRASGVKNYDCAVVCISENINDNILTTLLLKDIGVKRVVVRAISALHRRVLEKIGADQVVFPEEDMGEKLAYTLSRIDVLEYIELSEEFSIAELKIPSSWVGKNIAELDIRKKFGITVIAINDTVTGEIMISPSIIRSFCPADVVTVVGLNENINKFLK